MKRGGPTAFHSVIETIAAPGRGGRAGGAPKSKPGGGKTGHTILAAPPAPPASPGRTCRVSRRGCRGLSTLPGMAEAPGLLWGEAVRWEPWPAVPDGAPRGAAFEPCRVSGLGWSRWVPGPGWEAAEGGWHGAGGRARSPASAAPAHSRSPAAVGMRGRLLLSQLLLALWRLGLAG